MATFSKRSLDNLKGIHPDLVRVMEEAIKNTPIDFTITDGVRTADQQWKLYLQGRDGKINPDTGKAYPIVTNCDGSFDKSNHQRKPDGYGHAVDLYPYYNGSVQLHDVKSLQTIADHIKSIAKSMNIKIEWGGDWNLKGNGLKKDYPHFELK